MQTYRGPTQEEVEADKKISSYKKCFFRFIVLYAESAIWYTSFAIYKIDRGDKKNVTLHWDADIDIEERCVWCVLTDI